MGYDIAWWYDLCSWVDGWGMDEVAKKFLSERDLGEALYKGRDSTIYG